MVRGREVLAGLLVAALLLAVAVAAAHAAGRPSIHVLSNRADMVSAGNALVAIGLPRGAKPSHVRVRVGKRNVTRRFATRRNGHFEGLVTGLRVGRNVLRATLRRHGRRRSAKVTIVNHANGGPVL